jgi:catechol 2,3-dioxygenase-like lactoylglutathione lyase family enzyme
MSFAHLTIATRDVSSTAGFYRDIFGWRNAQIAKNSAVDIEWLDLDGCGQLHILGVPDFEPSPFEREYGRHFAFFVSAAEMPGVKQRLAERQIDLIPAERPTPFERIFFTDPNGYVIEVIDRDAWDE